MRRRTMKKIDDRWWESPEYDDIDGYIGEFTADSTSSDWIASSGWTNVSLATYTDPTTKRFVCSWSYLRFKDLLKIKSIYKVHSQHGRLALVENCPNLEYLDASEAYYTPGALGFYINDIALNCPKLHTIFYPKVGEATYIGQQDIFGTCPSLKTIHCSAQTKQMLQQHGGTKSGAAPAKWQDGGSGEWIIYD